MVVSWAHEAASESDMFASPDAVASLMAKHDLLDLRKAPADIREMIEFARHWKGPQKSPLLGRLLGRKRPEPVPEEQEAEFLRLARAVAGHYANTWSSP